MRNSHNAILMALAMLSSGLGYGQDQAQNRAARPRVVITADPELDDNNTLIRAILYSTDFQIEGLVYVSSMFHWKGDGKGTTQYIPGREYTRRGLCPCTSWRWPEDDRFIDRIVDAYAQAYPNLKVHDKAYPSPAYLKSKIKWGNVAFDGDYSQDTDGSNLIKSLLLDNRPGPLYVTAQGGQSTIARALKSIYDQYSKTPQWESIRNRVSLKLAIIPWGDQDGTYGRYIRPNWPEVTEWQLSMINYGYGIRGGLAPENQQYIGAPWTRDNILSRGPLGALYRVWGDGKQMSKGDMTDYFGMTGYTAEQLRGMGYVVGVPLQEKGSFISEGDTPTFLNLLDNGLRAYQDRSWGGWGGIVRTAGAGRGGQTASAGPDDPGTGFGVAPAGSTSNVPAAPAALPGNAPAGGGGAPGRGTAGRGRGGPSISAETQAVNARFFAASQNDFAARLKWSVMPKFADANHPPVVNIKGPMDVSGRPGDSVRLQGEVSDPDHNSVKVTWWQYNDAGTYPGHVTFAAEHSLATTFRIPDDATSGQTIHVILEATDSGEPALTRYRRVIVRIQ